MQRRHFFKPQTNSPLPPLPTLPPNHPGERTSEGFYGIRGGLEAAIARGVAYAPYADLVWFETSEPSMEQAEQFAKAIHEKYPGKLLAYNCR